MNRRPAMSTSAWRPAGAGDDLVRPDELDDVLDCERSDLTPPAPSPLAPPPPLPLALQTPRATVAPTVRASADS